MLGAVRADAHDWEFTTFVEGKSDKWAQSRVEILTLLPYGRRLQGGNSSQAG
jgi:hypothetical protein